METLNNPKPIQEIVKKLPNLKDKIDKSSNEFNGYLEYLKDEKFEEKRNEEIQDAIKRAESIYDRLGEMVERRKLVLKTGKETVELIDAVKLQIEEVVKSCENDGIHLENANEELIAKIIDLEDRKRIRDIKPLQQQIDEINRKFSFKKNEWEGNSIKRKKEEEERKRKQEEIRKQEEEKTKRMNTIIDYNEMKQLESWTQMKIGNIIFDSDIDDWNQNTSVFDQKILNKNNLIFLIGDTNGNKFGCYVNAKIFKYDDYINDPKSFVFSLKSNGRLNGMFKFDITESQYAFYLCHQAKDYLFLIGCGWGDILFYKENLKNKSDCQQNSFNYNGIENALCGKSYPQTFIPKRMAVIQLQ